MPGEKFTPDVPGRGAWTLQGGLISNSGGVTGYYQLPTEGQSPPGAHRKTDSEYCVHESVQRIQRMLKTQLGISDLSTNGVWQPETQAAMQDWQQDHDLEPATGAFGPGTGKWFWRLHMRRAGRLYDVPWRFLYGMTSRESGFDPAAVGVNGWDHGLVQINLDPNVHGSKVSRKQALNPSFCYDWAAKELQRVYLQWKGHTKADPWDVAIANHNSPLLAKKWGEAGEPPYVEGRVFQIEDYVIDIRARGNTA